MLLTPDGNPAGNIDRIMLLAIWTQQLHQEATADKPPIIRAGLGRPTFPISEYVSKLLTLHWSKIWARSQEARHPLNGNSIGSKLNNTTIAQMDAAVSYGDPKGESEAREKLAKALERWYGSNIIINPAHVIFTVGGAGGLYAIFKMLNRYFPQSRIITQVPYYSLYQGIHRENHLYPIHVMHEKGYRLTANALKKAIIDAEELAKQDGMRPCAFLLCDPNNPLGTVIEDSELFKIARVLRKYPQLLIILDEAYGEMLLYKREQRSLLSVAPDLVNRVILLRSATKALSAAGERMGAIVTFNATLTTRLLEEHVNMCGHAPRSLQHAFAEAIDKLDEIELANLNFFYRQQVEYVQLRLEKIGASLPDYNYRVEGTFYVVADFSDLFNLDLPPATQRVLNKPGVQRHTVKTDEDLVYYLLFKDRIMVAPLSYFGLSNKLGFIRITCSGGLAELKELMDRLEQRLIMARKMQQKHLLDNLEKICQALQSLNPHQHQAIIKEIEALLNNDNAAIPTSAVQIKKTNIQLKQLSLKATKSLIRSNPDHPSAHQTATTLQSWWRGIHAKKQAHKIALRADKEWLDFTNQIFPLACEAKKQLLKMPRYQRIQFVPWKNYLQNKTKDNVIDHKLGTMIHSKL